MSNSVRRATRAIKKAEVDIQKLGEKTARLIQDLNNIQASATSVSNRLEKDRSVVFKEISETDIRGVSLRKMKNDSKRFFGLCNLQDQIINVPEDLAEALRRLKYAHERLIK